MVINTFENLIIRLPVNDFISSCMAQSGLLFQMVTKGSSYIVNDMIQI